MSRFFAHLRRSCLLRLTQCALCVLQFSICAASAFAVSPYTPVRPDPASEPWRWTVFPELKGRNLECLAEDKEGRIWFGVRGGALVYDGVNWKEQMSEEVFGNRRIYSLCVARDGSVYAGFYQGVARFHDGAWKRIFPEKDPLPWSVWGLTQASDGSIWCGTYWGALNLTSARTVLYTTQDMVSIVRKWLSGLETVILPLNATPEPIAIPAAHAQHFRWSESLGAWVVWLDGPPDRYMVLNTPPDGPAANAELNPGDVITAVDGVEGANIWRIPGNQPVSLTVNREGATSTADVVFETGSMQSSASWFQIGDTLEDRDGYIWLAVAGWPDKGRAVRVDPRRARSEVADAWTLYTEADGLDPGGWSKFAQTPDGAIWMASSTNYQGISRFDPSEDSGQNGPAWTSMHLGEIGGTDINPSLTVSRDGTLWVGGPGSIHAYRDGEWRIYKNPDFPVPGNRLSNLLETSDGSLWMAGRNREVARLDIGDQRWATYGDLLFQCDTMDGATWFLSSDGGAVRWNGNSWQRYGTEDGLMDAPSYLFAGQDGRLWASGSQDSVAAVALFDGRQWEVQVFPRLSWKTMLPFEAPNGHLWVSAGGDFIQERGQLGGLLEYDGSSWTHHEPPAAPRLSFGAAVTAEDELWFGSYGTLAKYANGEWTTVQERRELGIGVDWLHSTFDGNVWIGTRTDGIYRYDGVSWEHWTDADGLAHNDIDRILNLPDGSILATTTRGVSRFDGTSWTPVVMPLDVGVSLHASKDGAIWANRTSQAVYVAHAWTLRSRPGWATEPFGLRTTRYRPDAGPPETELTTFARTVSQPGNTTLAWSGLDPWRATPNEHLQYAFRLNDDPWSAFSEKTHHIFELLPSGTHTFQVKARDLDFNEDPTPASVTFTVVPPVWQEPWFIGLMVVLVGAIGLQTGRIIRSKRKLQVANTALSTANKDLFAINVSLEEKTRSLERERAVERIREQVQTMESSEDFERVLSLLAEDLGAAGLAFDTSAIDVLDEPVDEPTMDHFNEHGFRYTAYTIDPGGAVTSDAYNIPAPFPPVNLETIERFIEGRPWQGRSEQTAILEVPIAGYGRLRLTASDRQDFDYNEIETLGDFAGAIALGYARFLDLKAVEAARQREMDELERELQVAHDMQMDLLPESTPEIEGFDLSGICVPANHVGGDYFQYVPLGDEGSRLAIVNADVSGKAMQAATVAMRFNEMLRYEVEGRTDGAEILQGLDRSLKGQIPETMFVTCGIGILDPSQRKLSFATAANPEVYHYVAASGEARPLSISGCPLGLPLDLGDQIPFNSTEVSLSDGDLVVFTSDGVEEAQNDSEEFYEGDRLANLIGELGGKGASADDVRDAIVEDVKRFIGTAPQSDDVTVIVIRATV
jgi:serine phosphatase RsbU (regulator of sigma subunit)/ligand-binding sensor domain-containing protein